MPDRRLLISFSGGETSALMTRLLLAECRDLYDHIVVVFANTGEENNATLEFVERCDKAYGFNVVWLEADVQHGARTVTKHSIVSFATASRDGRPYEEHIKKYGIPNQKFPHCTRELKLRPIQSYAKSIGWLPGTYDTAIGIRADEPQRRSPQAEAARLVYPLLDWWPHTKPQVNEFWMSQPFRLELRGYQGNCKWCWKKSMRKLLTIMDDSPDAFDFPARMEQTYGKVGAEFRKPGAVTPEYRRTFFRGNLSVVDIRALYAKGGFDRAEDDAIVLPDGRAVPLDIEPGSDGCSESCEVNFA